MTPDGLFAALVEAGLTVRTVSGWETNGGTWRDGHPVGVMQHHTAAPVPFPVDRLDDGGKLKCNVNTKPDGTVWLLAWRACNYSSGMGSAVVLNQTRSGVAPTANAKERGLTDDTDGNPWYWNFENDHLGDGGPIPEVQLAAIATATRVILDGFGLPVGSVVSHAEWTARKSDPYWNGSRRAIDELRQLIMEGADDMTRPKDWTAEDWAAITTNVGWGDFPGAPADEGGRSGWQTQLDQLGLLTTIRDEVRALAARLDEHENGDDCPKGRK